MKHNIQNASGNTQKIQIKSSDDSFDVEPNELSSNSLIKIYCKIYDKDNVSLGYTVAIDDKSINAWIKKSIYYDMDRISLFIEPPLDCNLSMFAVNLKQIRSDCSGISFNYVDFDIVDLNDDTKQKINHLISFFSSFAYNKL